MTLVALFKIGAFAVVGALLDALMWSSEKKKLRNWFDTLVLRMDYAPWRTLGRDEAAAALRLWDRVAGARLISGRRLFTTMWVVGLCQIANQVSYGHWQFGMYVREYVAMLMLVAISFSFTRLLSEVALRASDKWLPFSFFILLGVHVALFVLWAPITVIIFHILSSPMQDHGENYIISNVLNGRWIPLAQIVLEQWSQHLVMLRTTQDWINMVVNGSRIAFSLVFAGSYILVHLKGPILRLAYNTADSKLPFFTLVFGVIGAAVVTTHEFIKLL